MMTLLSELEHFLGTNEGRIAAWLVFLLIFAVIFQAQMVCGVQLGQVADACNKMCATGKTVQINNLSNWSWGNVSRTR